MTRTGARRTADMHAEVRTLFAMTTCVTCTLAQVFDMLYCPRGAASTRDNLERANLPQSSTIAQLKQALSYTNHDPTSLTVSAVSLGGQLPKCLPQRRSGAHASTPGAHIRASKHG